MFLLRMIRPLTASILMSSGELLPAPEERFFRSVEATSRIYLLADTLHTGLVFDLKWLESHGFNKPAEIGVHQMVVMSWGDELAYAQERWLSPLQVARALFTPTPSVMECIPIDWKVEEVCPGQRVYSVDVPDSAGRPLAEFLNQHSETDADGVPITIGPSSWGEGRLIRCPDVIKYDITRMCNDWTVEALSSAGLRIDLGGIVSAEGLVRMVSSQGSGFRHVWSPRKPAFGSGVSLNEPGSLPDPQYLFARESDR